MAIKGWILFFVFVILISGVVLAHENEISEEEMQGFNFSSPINYIILSGIWIGILISFILTIGREMAEKNKKLFFWLIITPIILSSLFLAGFTVYENVVSVTGGPIHWHADYQVHACGERLDLINPKGLRNKIGSPLYHEHNDDRIHIEGTVGKLIEINLERYFKVIGGELDDNVGHLIYPTDEEVINYKDGDSCSDGSIGSLKVYVNGKRVDDYSDYVIYPDSFVPPGDCIIILFDGSDSETTDLICDSWAIHEWEYDSYVRPVVVIGGKSWQ
jgi:hypothetical protein